MVLPYDAPRRIRVQKRGRERKRKTTKLKNYGYEYGIDMFIKIIYIILVWIDIWTAIR